MFERLLENAINRVVTDSAAGRFLAPLAGSVIALQLFGPDRLLYLAPTRERIEVTRQARQEPDVTICGGPSAFARTLYPAVVPAWFCNANLTITGNTELVAGLRDLIDSLDPDPEEQLARFMGDTAARKTANILHQLRGWAAAASSSAATSTGEVLREEVRLLTTRPRVERFGAGVERLRDDAEQLAQRIERLARQYTGS
ncbi:MAG: SCP2 sterol-binding domain-containing protein [Arenicellales bacterium]|jgi:ubiquinone biosynthesis protein UbiJ|nr:SCP2 sterol-binding domain-containing protein [Arenicellales bacterium]